MDEPLVRYDGTGTTSRRWLIADERGSIVAETNASGAAVQVNTYGAYGEPGNANTGRFGYTGQVFLGEVGLYHYKARAYNPEIGRFLQTDPIGVAGGMNLYAYVGGDPINATDPLGLEVDEEDIIDVLCKSDYDADTCDGTNYGPGPVRRAFLGGGFGGRGGGGGRAPGWWRRDCGTGGNAGTSCSSTVWGQRQPDYTYAGFQLSQPSMFSQPGNQFGLSEWEFHSLDPHSMNQVPSFEQIEAIEIVLEGMELGIVLEQDIYLNLAHPDTGAMLSRRFGPYERIIVSTLGGETRIIVGRGGQLFGTVTHYRSFFPIERRGYW